MCPKSSSSRRRSPSGWLSSKTIWKTKRTCSTAIRSTSSPLAPYSDLANPQAPHAARQAGRAGSGSADHAEPPPAVSDDVGHLRRAGRPAGAGKAVAVRRSEIQDGPRRHRGLLPDAQRSRRFAARRRPVPQDEAKGRIHRHLLGRDGAAVHRSARTIRRSRATRSCRRCGWCWIIPGWPIRR